MIVQGMRDLARLDPDLDDLVLRLGFVCLVEVAQPGALERFTPTRASALKEPPEERFVFMGQAAAITLAQMNIANFGSTHAICDVIEHFISGQLRGLSALAKHVNRSEAETVVRRASQLTQLLSREAASPKSFAADKEECARLAQLLHPLRASNGIVFALAANLGTLARLHGWTAADATEIIRSVDKGVQAGEAARDEERTKR